ncbi:RNA-directed DNA polymerase from mobile element jockey [Trichonephila clavipes]|nr:RNA-directed DNA polymerase from mobile element jockey [Trichonephila clavipes]
MLALSRVVSLFGSVPPSSTLCPVCRAHLAKDCTLSFDEPMRCANCSGEHAANWSRCPKHPNNAKRKNQNKRLDFGTQTLFVTKSTNIRVLSDLSSDHYPVILEINLNTSIIKNPEQLSTNWYNFKFALNKKPIPTTDLTSNENIELAISELNQKLSEAFVEASKPKFKNAPKILSPEIKSKIHQRNRLRKFWQRTRCPSIYSELRTLSREIAKDIQSHSRTQWEKHIEVLSPVFFSKRKPPPEITLQNQRIPWSQHTKYLGVIVDKNLTFRQHITHIRDKFKDTTCSTAITPFEKAEVIADSLQEQFEPNHVAGREDFDQRIHAEVENFLATPHVQEIKPTTPTEVLTYVQRITPRKSPGLDQIFNHAKLTFAYHIEQTRKKAIAVHAMLKKLISRRSKLAIRHKVLLYKSIIRPVMCYGSQIFGSTGMCHLKKLHTLTNSFLRQIVYAPWVVRNEVIYRDLKIKPFLPHIKDLSKTFFDKLPNVPNELISNQPAYDPAVPSSQKRPRALLDHEFINFP